MALDWTRDEIILACALTKKHGWRGLSATHPDVIELSKLLIAAPIHPVADRDPKFRNANGVGRKTADIATQHPAYAGVPTRGNKLDRIVLDEFLADPPRMDAVAASIRDAIRKGEVLTVPNEEIDADDLEADEGRILLAKHLRRERSRKLRARKIAEVKAEGMPIACEVCAFDFGATYGSLGEGYIEVHHVLPLHASGPIKSRTSDLALLCSNCHRMIHRARPWLTPDQLKSKLTP